jgi:hypothetical protein
MGNLLEKKLPVEISATKCDFSEVPLEITVIDEVPSANILVEPYF